MTPKNTFDMAQVGKWLSRLLDLTQVQQPIIRIKVTPDSDWIAGVIDVEASLRKCSRRRNTQIRLITDKKEPQRFYWLPSSVRDTHSREDRLQYCIVELEVPSDSTIFM